MFLRGHLLNVTENKSYESFKIVPKELLGDIYKLLQKYFS